MFPVVALIFLLVPALEIYLLIQVGSVIGGLSTALLVILTAVIGVQLLKSQGLATLSRAQQRMQEGEMPALELLEGIALLVAGAFLLTPGFFTDAVGFVLLFPVTRRPIIRYLSRHLAQSGRFVMHGQPGGVNPGREGDVIDGVSYRNHDDERRP
jgi:UPF0716 protein FxsA